MKPSIKGPGMGMLVSGGADQPQVPHLNFMGVTTLERGTGGADRNKSGLAPIDGADTRDNHFIFREKLEAQLLAPLFDVSEERTAAVGKHLQQVEPHAAKTTYDAVSLSLLESMGISPAWLLLLAITLKDFEIGIASTQADLTIYHRDVFDEPALALDIKLSDEVLWSNGYVRIRERSMIIPQTILANSLGRALKDIVSHPILDRYDLVVSDVTETGLIDVRPLSCNPLWNRTET